MKVLITGGSGMLGQFLNLELSKHFEILTQYKSNPGNCTKFNSTQLDLTDEMNLEKVFKDFMPDVVVHTAAVSNSERADVLSPNNVYKLNVNVTKIIADLCAKYMQH
jgi:dTDP-4-dehydrorhamnose reductase